MEFDLENTFNSEEYLYFYGDIFTPERLNKEVDFLVRFAGLDSPKKILDLACGHGRHANALAQAGHQITGMDITEGFLTIAKADASRLGLNVNYIREDMRNLNDHEAFDRIFCLYTAIGYFEDDKNEEVFRKIHSALKPGGIFCFDSHNRDTYLTYFLPASIEEREGNYMLDQRSFDSLTGHSITKRTILYKNAKKSFTFTVRFYNPTEIIKLFKQIGFSEILFYENWLGNPLTQDAKRMIVVARK